MILQCQQYVNGRVLNGMAGKEAAQERLKAQASIAQNRRAWHEYEILETFEAGMVLTGTEVKSLRAHRVSLADAYGMIKNNELFLMQCHIAEYTHSSYFNHVPLRPRKLLVHKTELRKMWDRVTTQGQTLVPLKMYFKRGRAKVEMALVRGKLKYDKRDAIRKREDKLTAARACSEKD